MYTMYAYTEPQPFRIKTVKPARHPQQPHFSSNLGSPKFRLKPPNHNSLSLSVVLCRARQIRAVDSRSVSSRSQKQIPPPQSPSLYYSVLSSSSVIWTNSLVISDLNICQTRTKKKKKIYLLNFQILSTLEKWVVLSLGVLGFVKFIFIGIWGFWNSGCEFLLSNNGARITKEEAWWDGPRALERTDYVC